MPNRTPVLLATAMLILAFFSTAGGARPDAPASAPAPARREAVVLVHGLGRTHRSLKSLHAALEQAGFRPVDWPYTSWRGRFETHAARLAKDLEALSREPGVSKVHAVGHSLGGIVLRRALLDAKGLEFGRLVQLVPPNHGSGVARFFSGSLGALFPILHQLSDDAASAVNRLGVPTGVEIGVIAAGRDHLVKLESTHLEGEKDHLLVPASHSFLMNRDDVIEATITFLREGKFR